MRPVWMRSNTKRLPLVGPLERLGHGAVEVRDEGQHLVAEIIGGGEVASPQQLANQNTEPLLHLVQPRRMLRRVMEDNFVGWVGQKGSACRQRLQNAASLLYAEVSTGAGDLGNVAHQA